MFNYPEKTSVNLKFKMLDLFKSIKADRTVKKDAENIISVTLTNIISPSRANLSADKNVKEIYIIRINLKTSRIPELFLKAFNNQIFFQTIFKLCYNDEVKYFSSIKVFNEEKMKVLKICETAWQSENKIDFPITTKLATAFKSAIEYITNQKFKQDETYEKYIERLNNIKKLNAEIERLTKLMNAEKQPNLKMNLNDRIKEIKLELQKMEEINGKITNAK